MANHKKNSNETEALKKELSELRIKVAELQKELDEKKSSPHETHKKHFRWQSLVIWVCVVLASILLVLGNIFFWTGNTLVDTNRYVAAVGPLIQKPEIQTAIAGYTTNEVFDNLNVQQYVQNTLPPKASFLAPQLTAQLKGTTQSTIKSILANPKVQSYWYSSLAKRHQALISFSKSYEGNGKIDVSDIYGQLSKRLGDTKLSFLANKQLPEKVGSIQVTTVGWLPALHKISKNIGLYQFIATLLLIVFMALSIFLAKNRRRMVIRLGIIFTILMLLTLVALRITRGVVVSDINPTYQSAAQVAYDTVLHSFVTQTLAILLISLLIVIIAWITGPYKSVVILRDRTSALLSGKLHQSIFGNKENGFTLFIGKYKRYIQWGIVLLAALIILLVQITPKLVVIYAILMLVCILIIEFLAAPGEGSK